MSIKKFAKKPNFNSGVILRREEHKTQGFKKGIDPKPLEITNASQAQVVHTYREQKKYAGPLVTIQSSIWQVGFPHLLYSLLFGIS